MGGLLHLVHLAPPSSLLTVPNVTAHPSTACVLITVGPIAVGYNGPLLQCGFNVPIKG